MILTIVSFIFVLGLLIFIHEFGHFIFAKIFGMRVERFSLGYPPRLFGKQIGDTDYCLSATPLGGYCKISGMVDESLDKDSVKGEPWEFQSKPVYARFLVIFAGPLMNYVLAVVVFTVVVFFEGMAISLNTPVIGEVYPDYPAAKAGVLAGDRILSVNNINVETWDQINKAYDGKVGVQVDLKIQRGEETIDLNMTSIPDETMGENSTRGIIGIFPEYEIKKFGIFGAVKIGFQQTFNLTKLILSSLKKVILGEESIKSFGGPIIIAKMAGQSAEAGIGSLFVFTAFLSINLALLNLLPIPALDGGHLIFLSIEGITRKKISTKVKLVFQQIGMLLLLILVVIIIYNDVLRVFK